MKSKGLGIRRRRKKKRPRMCVRPVVLSRVVVFSSSTLERPARDVDIVTALRVHIRFPPQFLCVVLTLLFGVALILSI